MKALKSILLMLWLLLLGIIWVVILSVGAPFVLALTIWGKLLRCLKHERNQKNDRTM
jgi:hypothetical protein